MGAKKVYQVSLVLCGLFLALSGIACLVVATLLNHDSDLKMSHESKSRTYATQYWLGLPIIAFGGLLMLISPSLHRRKTMAALSLLSCIPLITCALAGSILHGTAYSHFLSIRQHRLFLEDHSYLCSDDIQDDSIQCKCTNTDPFEGRTNSKLLPVPCDQQKSLVGFHGALLTFSAVAFSLLLGILVICVILLPQFLKLQPSMGDTAASGQNNEGFSHARGSTHSIDVHNDTPPSQHASQTTLNIINDHPPSYESLLTSFNMTSHGMASRNNTSQDTIVTYEVATERNMAATVNRQARVRYRGELSSNQIPRQTDQGESSPNDELLNSNGLENVGTDTPNRGSIPQNRPGEATPLRTSQGRQGSHELNTTTDNENREVTSNETNRQQTALNDINEQRSEQNNEPSIEIRSGRNTHPSLEASGEIVAHEEENSSGPRIRNPNPSAEQPSDINVRMIRTPHPSSIELSTDLQVAYEEGNLTHLTPTDRTPTHPTPTDRPPTMEPEGEVVSHGRNIRYTSPSTGHSGDTVRHDSRFMDHTPLGRTVSDSSEDGVYIDITRNPAHRSNFVPSDDSAHMAVRYRGQVDSTSVNSIQTQSRETHEQEDNADENVVQENLQERTHEDHNSLNSVNSDTSEQTADSNQLNNDTAEAVDNPIQEEENPSENPHQRDSESLSSESSVSSVSSLEMSI